VPSGGRAARTACATVLFSIDYPYEDARESAEWIERAPLTEAQRAKASAPVPAGAADRLPHGRDDREFRPSLG
jgi:hypothetical protein